MHEHTDINRSSVPAIGFHLTLHPSIKAQQKSRSMSLDSPPAPLSIDGFETLPNHRRYQLKSATNYEARAKLQQFIARQFFRHFQAGVPDDTRELIGAFAPDGHLVAAFGLRTIRDGFFSQCYLQDDLSVVLERLRPKVGAVRLHQVVELNHLCVDSARNFRRLVPEIASLLRGMGFHYLICTATNCLVRCFSNLSLNPIVLAEADRERLPAESRDAWGSYYDASPLVIFGALDPACNGIHNHTRSASRTS